MLESWLNNLIIPSSFNAVLITCNVIFQNFYRIPIFFSDSRTKILLNKEVQKNFKHWCKGKDFFYSIAFVI